jgi:hypothetical protein
MNHELRPACGRSRRTSGLRAGGITVAIALLAVLPLRESLAQAPAGTTSAAAELPAEELETLVGRIALYPDDLVAIILPASTNPLQIVQADRFLAKRKTDPKAPVDEKWDDAVKSLLNYPEIVTMMSGDLDWTAALGEAVVADQASVLDAVQAFRRKTQAAGNLNSDQKQVVVVEKEVIKIVPADPEVIYVPQYNPSTVVVYGSTSAWGYYPSPYPVYYYPYAPGAAFATGLIWGAAISSAWRGNHYAAHYGGNANININRNTNINTGDINRGNVNRGDVNRGGGDSSRWTPDKQRGQVSSSVGAKQPARVGDSRASSASAATRPTSMQTGGGGGRDVSAGNRSAGPSASTGAFDGYGSGHQTRADSSRGSASRSAAASRPTRQGGGAGGGRSRR